MLSLFYSCFSTVLCNRHYFYFTEEGTAPKLQSPMNYRVHERLSKAVAKTTPSGRMTAVRRSWALPILPQSGALPGNPPALDSQAAVTFPRASVSLTNRHSPSFPKAGKSPQVRVPAYSSPGSTELTGRRRPYAVAPRALHESGLSTAWLTQPSKARLNSHHSSSQLPAGPPLGSQVALAAHRDSNLVAPA